jgi:hypothetical protein
LLSLSFCDQEAGLAFLFGISPAEKGFVQRESCPANSQIRGSKSMKKLGKNILLLSVGSIAVGLGIAFAVRSLVRPRRATDTVKPLPRHSTDAITPPHRLQDDHMLLPDGSPVMPSTSRGEVALVALDGHVQSVAVFTDMKNTGMTAIMRAANDIASLVEQEEPASANQQATMGDGQAADDQTAEWQWIGNARTHVYHRADSHFLPSEANREYFASEDAAHQAGYRRAVNE